MSDDPTKPHQFRPHPDDDGCAMLGCAEDWDNPIHVYVTKTGKVQFRDDKGNIIGFSNLTYDDIEALAAEAEVGYKIDGEGGPAETADGAGLSPSPSLADELEKCHTYEWPGPIPYVAVPPGVRDRAVKALREAEAAMTAELGSGLLMEWIEKYGGTDDRDGYNTDRGTTR